MISRIIREILTYSQETKTLISVRKRNSDDNVWVGYIVDFNDTLFVLQHISSLGLEDGMIIERIDNIDNFEIEDNYIKSIQLLFDNQNRIQKQIVKTVEISNEDNWQYELLKIGFDQGKIITVEVNNSDTVNFGFVLDYDDTSLQLKAITKTGEDDGIETYRLADITSITVDRLEGRKRQLLHEIKKKKRNPGKGK
ncbi:hypothetical protein [Ferruginibacter profundus]